MNAGNETFDANGTTFEEGMAIEFTTTTEGYTVGERYQFIGEFHGLLARFQPASRSADFNGMEVTPSKIERWMNEERITVEHDDTVPMVGALDESKPAHAERAEAALEQIRQDRHDHPTDAASRVRAFFRNQSQDFDAESLDPKEAVEIEAPDVPEETVERATPETEFEFDEEPEEPEQEPELEQKTIPEITQ